MKRFLSIFLLSLTLFLTAGLIQAASDPNDREGSKDPPLFNRMPGYYITRCEEKEFDSYQFPTAPGKTQTVEGHHYYVIYSPNDGIKVPSPLQIGRNYANAVKAIGGQTVYEFHDPDEDIVLKVTKNGVETWAYISASGNGDYVIHLVEKQLMNQDVVANADALAQSIKASGKAAVYGIYFDTGKSVVKPESESAIQEIVKLLKANPSLKLYVVGHTDNVGTIESNMKLSKDRADAVVKALTAKGVAAARLQAYGDGPLSPVESNQTEDGRAKNRRVELVAQ